MAEASSSSSIVLTATFGSADKTDCTSPSPTETECAEDKSGISAGPSSEDSIPSTVIVSDIPIKCTKDVEQGGSSDGDGGEVDDGEENDGDEDWFWNEPAASDDDSLYTSGVNEGLSRCLNSSWPLSQHSRSCVSVL